jgi:hypothetical protein
VSGSTHRTTFSALLRRCRQVVVPQIQRDYAQGSDTHREVRDRFLGALHAALSLPVGHERLPLNLDFVYGKMEQDGSASSFLPLDGQQRLTTLFLLHWYLAWQDGQLHQFKVLATDGSYSRFCYKVRPSSTDFFNRLVHFEPAGVPDAVASVKDLIEDQPWFVLHWRRDPTVESVLAMLDAIHGRFRESKGLYSRLLDETHPAVTFHLIPLEHLGLTDDLYIKMNARGKPLTVFETFKGRFEEDLKALYPTEQRQIDGRNVPATEYFALRMDTQWTDFFWRCREAGCDVIDDNVMNLLWALAWVTLEPNSRSFTDDNSILRYRFSDAEYTTFRERGWLTKRFGDRLMCLLEAWGGGGGKLSPRLPSARYFDEQAFFQLAIRRDSLAYEDLVQFAAFVSYLERQDGTTDADAFEEWARVIFNLSVSSDIERPEDYKQTLMGIQALLPWCSRILQELAAQDLDASTMDLPGFSDRQLREEILKAKLIVADGGWRTRIDAAEQHGYFRGQIEFLLDFAGVSGKAAETPVAQWSGDVHADLQPRFDGYLAKAQLTFDGSGLNAASVPKRSYQWERALLVCGDYLRFNSPSNHSFLENAPSRNDSWKRLLRSDVSGGSRERDVLKALWDRIVPDADIGPQLQQVIRDRSGLEPWREVMVTHPLVIDYCERRQVRRVGSEVYLLRKSQMNGAHAELFSYALHLDLNTAAAASHIVPLRLQWYESVSKSDREPYVLLAYPRDESAIHLRIESAGGQFLILVERASLTDHPDVETTLRERLGFAAKNSMLCRPCSREGIADAMREIARGLGELDDKAAAHT